MNRLPSILEKFRDVHLLVVGDLMLDRFIWGEVERLSPERVLFGSNFPLFYFEAARLKIEESGLPEDQKSKLFEGNARQLLSR